MKIFKCSSCRKYNLLKTVIGKRSLLTIQQHNPKKKLKFSADKIYLLDLLSMRKYLSVLQEDTWGTNKVGELYKTSFFFK